MRTCDIPLTVMAGLVLAPLALAGCTTATPYRPVTSQSVNATGYDSQKLAEGRYRVSFAGNAMTSRETVENYLLYRAAELTIENGYRYFSVAHQDTERKVETRVDRFGSGGYGYWGPTWRYYRPRFGWNTWDPFYGDPFWGNDIDVRTVDRYEAFAQIDMKHSVQSGDDGAFEAQDVINNLRSTIKVPE